MDNQRAASAACPKETMVLPGVPIRRAYGPHCSLKAQPQHPAVALRMPGWLAYCSLPSPRPLWVGDWDPGRGRLPPGSVSFFVVVLSLSLSVSSCSFPFPLPNRCVSEFVFFVWIFLATTDAPSDGQNVSQHIRSLAFGHAYVRVGCIQYLSTLLCSQHRSSSIALPPAHRS